MQHTTYNIHHTSYNLQNTTYNINLKHKTNNIQDTSCSIQHTTYNIQHTTYNMQHTKYSIQHTTYNTQHTTYNIQHTICNKTVKQWCRLSFMGTGQFILRPFFLRQVTAWGLGLGPGLVFWLGLGWEKISWGEKSHTQFHAPNPQLWLIPRTSNTALFSSHTFFCLFRGGRDSRKKLKKGGTKLEVFNLTCQGRYRPCVGGTRVLFTGLVDACWQVLLPSWKRAVCLTNVTCLTSLQLNEFFFRSGIEIF